jgi:hypothetical protein
VIYLASPYSHSNKQIEQLRYEAVSKVCARLARSGAHVYSPIAHWHPIAISYRMPTNHLYYKDMNKEMITLSSGVWILMLPEWNESKGVQEEIKFAQSIGRKVTYINE